MEYVALFLIGLSVTLSVAAAAMLAYLEKPGWGWFLFIALLLASGLKVHIQ